MVFRGGVRHHLARLRRTGERDVVDARMRGQRSAGFMAVAGDDVQRAGGQAHFGGDLGQLQQRQARVFGGLDHAGVARGQRRANATAEDLQGVVPGHDVARHAMRFAYGQHGEARGNSK
ncbi:hypothetical protein G6F68_016944 [Rhizopus microsporus]|nr:hypothetical protein G6F68_016944 [Rhizopus microsporus]